MKILYTLVAVGLAAGLTMTEARAGKTLHVEIWGQNNPLCGSESNPCRTLGYTVSQRANPKDRLVVGPGDYQESVIIHRTSSGILLDGLRIESKLGRSATSIRSPIRYLPALQVIASDVGIGIGDKGFTLRSRVTQKPVVAFADAMDAY